MSGDLGEAIVREAMRLLEPIHAAAASERVRARIFDDLGYRIHELNGFPLAQLNAALGAFGQAYDTLSALATTPPQTPQEIADALLAVNDLVDAVVQLRATLQTAGVGAAEAQAFGRELVDYLVVRYLVVHHPVLLAVAELLAIVRRADESDGTEDLYVNNQIQRHARHLARLDLAQIPRLLSDPVGTLRAEYVPNGLATDADAQATMDKVVRRLSPLLLALGAEVGSGARPGDEAVYGTVGYDLASRMLTVISPELGGARLGATLSLSSQQSGGIGLVVSPFGDLALDVREGGWGVRAEAAAGVDAFAISRNGFRLLAASGVSRFRLKLAVERFGQAGQPAFRFGSATGTRLELGTLVVTGHVDLDQGRDDYGLLVEALRSAVVVGPGDGDGFLQRVLPQEGFRVDFDLGIGWSKRRGLYLRGGAGVEIDIPVHLSILGVLEVDTVRLALAADGATIKAVVATSPRLHLGPVSAVVDRIGMQVVLDHQQPTGNLGPVDLSFGFKWPEGAGLLIDAGPVKGGGYLSFNLDQQEYAGVLQLSFSGIALKAVGLLNTRLPDGRPGFSLLAIISGEFPPIQLGYGFVLLGVGGLLGVHRTVNVEALQGGFRNGNLDSIMFPPDPVRNAPQILSDLRAIFPVAEGRYVFGPMVKLGWGTPTIITAELGLILELPSPLRLILLGKVRTSLPTEEVGIVRIQADILGILDFDRRTASIDATLRDSRLAVYVLTGDMAMRLQWGAGATFALSAGGLHPRFRPPPGFPSLRRLAIALAVGNNPRIRLEAYLALTANTAQVGARLEIYAAAGGFSIEGDMGFDALFEFSPFHFIVDMTAGVALKRGSRALFSVRLDFTLEGPTPWHAHGKATFKILFLKVSVGFDCTFGEPDATLLPPGDALGELLRALGQSGNWSASLPGRGDMLVTLAKAPPAAADEVVAHPLGALTVRQRAVPLDVTISKFGSASPGSVRHFRIRAVKVDQRDAPFRMLTETFAVGQFFELTHDQALSRPSFEEMHGGVQAASHDLAFGAGHDAAMEYETLLVDAKEETVVRIERYTVTGEVAAGLLGVSAAALVVAEAAGRFAGPDLGIRVNPPDHTVVSVDDLVRLDLPAAGGRSYTAQLEALAQHLRAHPEDATRLQVVRATEAASP